MSAKLADLGLSRLLEDGASEQSTRSMIGPVRWMAPEALTEQRYSPASDAWSFGVLMWEVWSGGAIPYGNLGSVADVATAVVREGKRLETPSRCPATHASLISRLFATQPNDRPSMSKVFQELDQRTDDANEFDGDSDMDDVGSNTAWPSDMDAVINMRGIRYHSNAMVTGDFDNDGHEDIAMTGGYWYFCGSDRLESVGILRGGTGGNAARFDFPLSVYALSQLYSTSVAVDIDQDGWLDLIVADQIFTGVVVLRNLQRAGADLAFEDISASAVGSMTFQTTSPTPVGNNLMTTMDINGDGYPDFWRVQNSPGRTNVGLNMRNSTFREATAEVFGSLALAPPGNSWEVLWSDVNGDSRVDLVLLARSTPARVFTHRENGTLVQVPTNLPLLTSDGAASADFTGDGLADVVLTNSYVSLYRSLGDGQFVNISAISSLPVTNGAAIRAVDLNGDDNMDVVWNGFDSQYHVGAAVGLGDGSFSPPASTTAVFMSDMAVFPAGSYFFVVGVSTPFWFGVVSPTPALGPTDPFPVGEAVTDASFPSSTFYDVNQDGCLDVTMCGEFGTTKSCYLLTGTCTGEFVFDAGASLPGLAPANPLRHDFDGDGVTDLFLVGDDEAFVEQAYYYLSSIGLSTNVYGVHTPAVTIDQVLSHFWQLVDWNRDNITDIVAAGVAPAPRPHFWVGVGNGTFEAAAPYPVVGPSMYWAGGAFAFGTIRKDSDVLSLFSSTFYSAINYGILYVGQENGTFIYDPAAISGTPEGTGQYAFDDLDGDGYNDIFGAASSLSGSSFMFVAFNLHNETFAQAAWPIPRNITEAAIGPLGSGEFIITGLTTGIFAGFFRVDANRTVSIVDGALPDNAGRIAGSISVGDIDDDGENDLIVLGQSVAGCEPPTILMRREPPAPVTNVSTTTGESAGSSSDDAELGLYGIIGLAAGGGLLGILALFAVCCGAAVLCACALVLCVCVCVVAVAVVAVVVVAAAAVVGGVGLGGGGGAMAVLAMRRGPRDDMRDLECAEEQISAAEVAERMRQTTQVRHVNWDDLRFGRKIGEGAYGSVFAGQWEGVKVAIKVIGGTVSADTVREFEHEALMMSKVSHHPHIVKFIGAVLEVEHLAMVLWFCDGGSLDVALANGKVGVNDKRRILSEVAGALHFLHSQGIVHRDVAARNVLLDGRMSAKLADLGLARLLEDGATEQNTKSNVGPFRWMAPEALMELKYSTASDAWAFGVLIFEVFSNGETPYSHLPGVSDVVTEVVRNGYRLTPSQECSPTEAKLMSALFNSDPSKRPPLSDAVEIFTIDSDSTNIPTAASSAFEYSNFTNSEAPNYASFEAQ